MKPGVYAKVFWQLYESAEARLINKYLNPELEVIELGASLGIISTLIADKIGSHKIVCVEANQNLMASISYNLKYIGKTNYELINAAIAYGEDQVYFSIDNDDNLVGKICSTGANQIKTISLSEIVAQNRIKNYALVCDIEGAEVGLFKFEETGFHFCEQIICEVHATTYQGITFSIENIIAMIIAKGYYLRKTDGNCFVFEKTRPDKLPE